MSFAQKVSRIFPWYISQEGFFLPSIDLSVGGSSLGHIYETAFTLW